jgi:hypothetical protein
MSPWRVGLWKENVVRFSGQNSAWNSQGHSGSTIAKSRPATTQWLFHKEKATEQEVGKGT